MTMQGEKMLMTPVRAIDLPANQAVALTGNYHLMFMGLSKAQKVGDSLPATLVFASGARVKVSFVVSLAPPADPHAGH